MFGEADDSGIGGGYRQPLAKTRCFASRLRGAKGESFPVTREDEAGLRSFFLRIISRFLWCGHRIDLGRDSTGEPDAYRDYP